MRVKFAFGYEVFLKSMRSSVRALDQNEIIHEAYTLESLTAYVILKRP